MFDLLPTEIKRKIFLINRQDALNKKYKKKYGKNNIPPMPTL